MELNLENSSGKLNSILEKILIKLEAFSTNDIFRNVNSFPAQQFIFSLPGDKDDFVQVYFMSDLEGNAFSSDGRIEI